MKERLYYQEPYRREFDATVLSCEKAKKGFSVILDKSAFYPEGGGQPCDVGVLGGTQVTEVHDRAGAVVHTCSGYLEPGTTVHGEIDWARRFDLMQQHSGEHLVSGLVNRIYGYDNVGFHMGKDAITIDFNGMIDEKGLREIERLANEAVWADLPAEIFYPSPEELAALPFRSKKELTGEVRLVRFPGVDLCACCGTHVAHTGEIGLIQLLSAVKFHEGVRIEMLCGRRCLERIRVIRDQNHAISVLLSAKEAETADGAARVLAELERAKLRISSLEESDFRAKAAAFSGKERALLFEGPMEPDAVRRLCDRVLSGCGSCAVFAGDDTNGYKYAVGSSNQDLRAFCRELNSVLRGRGGGKPNFVQGSLSAKRTEIEQFLTKSGVFTVF